MLYLNLVASTWRNLFASSSATSRRGSFVIFLDCNLALSTHLFIFSEPPNPMDSSIDPEVSKCQFDNGAKFIGEDNINDVDSSSKGNNIVSTLQDDESEPLPKSSSTAEAALSLLNDLRQREQEDDLNDSSSASPANYLETSQKMDMSKPEMKLYQYDPDEKPLRLGRPRKNMSKPVSPPETHSNKNYNKAIMSKFRFDSLPVEGPGSRGGKNSRKQTRGKITQDAIRKRQQSVLNFSVVKEPSSEDATSEQKNVSNDNNNGKDLVKLTVKAPQERSQLPSFTPEPKRQKLGETHAVTHVRRTLAKRNPKALPSPLIPISFVEDFLVHNDESRLTSTTQLALRYPIQKAPYANDIIYLISFLTKFRDIILVQNLGPKSFESGLSLPALRDHVESTRYALKNKPIQNESDYDVSYVSPEMDNLFKKLLTLVLNRKKDVVSASSAIQELKPQSAKLGLPKEWKVYSPIEDEVYDAGEPVDPNQPEILVTEFPKESDFVITFNPFYNNEFEANGLRGLSNPLDRLLILKTLAQWSLSTSDAIKNFISQNVLNQELPGEKDTYYASRALLFGFENCHQAKLKANARLSKMKSTEEDLKYVDPTSNPTVHSMNLRLVDHLVGDLGFYAGRFYLCRMADGENGGLASVKKMSSVLKGQDVGLGTVAPSDFKLYVQDTHLVLTGALQAEGVEFDDDGSEVKNSTYRSFDDCEHWYEVASNANELKDFIDFLELLMEDTKRHSTDLYFSIQRLHDYLSKLYPLLQRQESLETTSRQKRKKTIDYSDTRAAAKYDDAFGEMADEGLGDNRYDDDNYIDDGGQDVNDSEDDDEYVD